MITNLLAVGFESGPHRVIPHHVDIGTYAMLCYAMYGTLTNSESRGNVLTHKKAQLYTGTIMTSRKTLSNQMVGSLLDVNLPNVPGS